MVNRRQGNVNLSWLTWCLLVERPCKRCVQAGREDNCFDVQHKKRGRPRRRDREESMGSIASNSGSMDGTSAMLVPEMIRSSFSLTQPVQGVNQCANSPSTKASQMVTVSWKHDCLARWWLKDFNDSFSCRWMFAVHVYLMNHYKYLAFIHMNLHIVRYMTLYFQSKMIALHVSIDVSWIMQVVYVV